MIRVNWSDDDNQWVATCDEYPSLSWLDDNICGAVLGLDKLRRDINEGRA